MTHNLDIRTVATAADEVREILGDDFDAETFWDTLDGETDVNDTLDRLISAVQHDLAYAAAVDQQCENLKDRAERFRFRAYIARRVLKRILEQTGERKVERPGATLSVQKGRARVVIYDDTSVPSQLCKTTVKPDLTAIKKQIDAGEDVPGARVETGPDTLQMRVK